jgi:hypothetical protein
MGNVLIHKASELKPGMRVALEAELGRSLRDNEEVSIIAFEPHEAPKGNARKRAARKVREHFSRIDRRTKQSSAKELNNALREALGSVRPGYRERA